MTDELKNERRKDFEKLGELAEQFINKWGDPHSVIVIEQGSIVFYEGEIGMPLEIPD